MPRKGQAEKRVVAPDPVYGSELMQRFINRMMLDGKKAVAEKIFYTAIAAASEKVNAEPVELFEKVVANVMPSMEVRPKRVGGQTYQVPMDVRTDRKRALAFRWLVVNSRKRSGKSMIDKLSAELVDAFNGTGSSMKKKEETHRMAEANKAFSHYRF
ncbi:MAG: 30S ribosomal protein S7 [Armatimonadetes bacterium]|nr:30S ribosomal protein S7 [Armatimonadota bacterium]